MARREKVAPPKLLFLVEGDAEKAFIEGLVPRVVGAEAGVRVVRVGSKLAFSSTFFEAAKFLDAGYAGVFLAVDADTDVAEEIAAQKRELVDVFRRYALLDRVRICMAVPMLETWLLAAYQEHPERSRRPKRELGRLLGAAAAEDVRSLAVALPIDVVRRRSRSFDDFVTELEAFAPKRVRRAS